MGYLEQNLIKMKELYNELLERETYLKSIEQTEQVQTRLSELMLVMVRVQQLILPIVSKLLPERKGRCCGRCDGVHDLCFSDIICDVHSVLGCEDCYGKR